MVREIGRELDGDDELEDDPKPFAAVAENDEGFEEYVEEEVKLTEKELQEVAMSSEEASRRRNDVIRLLDGRGGVCSIVEYSFDTVEQSWCELTLSFDITRKRVDMTNVIRFDKILLKSKNLIFKNLPKSGKRRRRAWCTKSRISKEPSSLKKRVR